MLQFINSTIRDDGSSRPSAQAAKIVRSQAMRDFRKRQRDDCALRKETSSGRTRGRRTKQERLKARDIPRTARACAGFMESERRNMAPEDKSTAVNGLEKQTSTKGFLESMPDGEGKSRKDQVRQYIQSKIVSMDLMKMYRAALTADFLVGYFGNAVSECRNLNVVLNQWTSPLSPAMSYANDALALLYVGNESGDIRVVLGGRRTLLLAINRLRFDLEHATSHVDGLLAAIQVILKCEAYDPVSPDSRGWTRHVTGLNALLKTRMNSSRGSMLRPFLLVKMRHLNLMHSFISRCALANSIGDSSTIKGDAGSVASLVRLALRLPTIFEASSRQRAASTSHNFDLRSTMEDLHEDLKHWLLAFETTRYRRYGEGALSYKPDSTVGARFDEDWLKSGTNVLGFASFLSASIYTFYWTCSLLLNQALLDLADDVTTGERRRDLMAQIEDNADRLRTSIPYLWQTATGSLAKGCSIRAPLHFASEAYQRLCKWPQWAQCQVIQAQARVELSHLQWDALLPWSFLSMYWLALG